MERNCDNCKYRNVYYMAPPCDECNFEYQRQPQKGFQNWEPDAMTNADRIRSLSDEELAEWLAILTDCVNCPCRDPHDQCDTVDGSCKKQWLNWLKKEVEERNKITHKGDQ